MRKDRFTGPNEAIDYFVTVYLPYRDDLYKYNNLDNMWHNEHTYLRIGHNVVLTYNGGFSNINEQEVYDFIGDYMDYGVSGLTYYLIGFYYNNHNKYNLSIDMLKYALDNYESFVDYMLLNNLDYRRLSEEKVLEYFQNSFNKTIIK